MEKLSNLSSKHVKEKSLKPVYKKIWKLPSTLFFNIYVPSIMRAKTFPFSVINNMIWLSHTELPILSHVFGKHPEKMKGKTSIL